MLALLLSVADAKEPDKTGFYIAGGVLVIWALAVTFYGMRTEKWPPSLGGQRVVLLVSVLLVAAAMASAVLTS
jgi:hypothetical protein